MSTPVAPLTKPGKNLLEVIEAQKPKFALRLPEGVNVDQFVLGIATAVQKSIANSKPGKSLADCDPTSVLLAAYEAAELGCSLAPSQALGWLIPYGGQAQFQPSYRFFIQKAFETGDVKTFLAEVVYKGDKFERQLAPKKNLFHQPGGDRVRETAIGAYAFIEYNDGTIDYEYLTFEQIDRHRKQSKQPNSMKWVDFWEEGWKISCIRVLSKRLPIEPRKLEVLMEALARIDVSDLKIGNDAVVEDIPTKPRRLSDRVGERVSETGAPAAAEATREQTQEVTEPQQSQTTVERIDNRTDKEMPAAAAETSAEKAAPAAASMFDESDTLTQAEAASVWDMSFKADWKKTQLVDFLKKNYGVSGPKELRKAQLEGVLDEIEKHVK